jgi:hypothetical protein
VRRFFETVLIVDLSSAIYRQQPGAVKSQILGVFRDWYVGLKSLSEKGLLHIGAVKALLCNFIGIHSVLIISIAAVSSLGALPIVLVTAMGVDLMHWYQRGQDDASFLIPIALTAYILDTSKSVPDQLRCLLDNPRWCVLYSGAWHRACTLCGLHCSPTHATHEGYP